MPDSAYHKAEAERLLGCLTHELAGQMTYGDHKLSLLAGIGHATLATVPDEPTATVSVEDLYRANYARIAGKKLPVEPSEATVETVARVIHDHNCGGRTRCWNRDTHWQVWQKDARAVLAAIGGES